MNFSYRSIKIEKFSFWFHRLGGWWDFQFMVKIQRKRSRNYYVVDCIYVLDYSSYRHCMARVGCERETWKWWDMEIKLVIRAQFPLSIRRKLTSTKSVAHQLRIRMDFVIFMLVIFPMAGFLMILFVIAKRLQASDDDIDYNRGDSRGGENDVMWHKGVREFS